MALLEVSVSTLSKYVEAGNSVRVEALGLAGERLLEGLVQLVLVVLPARCPPDRVTGESRVPLRKKRLG